MSTDLLHAAPALVVLVLAQWVPGLALCRLVSPGASRATRLAVAPAVSTGLLYVLGETADRVGAPVVPVLPLAILALGSAVLVHDAVRARGLGLRGLPPAVLGGWLIGTTIWSLGIRHLTAVPPHNDGYNHGYFVARIAHFATLDPSTVIAHDVISGGKGADFYPLALHQQAAVVVRLFDLDVGVAWTLATLSVVVLAFPLGAYVLSRGLFPDNLGAARASAVVAALAPGATYSTSWFGGYPLAAGMAMSAGLLAWLLLPDPRARDTVIGAFGLAGIAGAHTSEWTMVAVIAAAAWAGRSVASRDLRASVRRAVVGASPFALSMLLLLPVLAQLRRGLDERTYPAEAHGLPFGKTILEVLVQFSFVPPSTPPAVWLATLLGIAVAVRRRQASGWIVGWTLFGILYVWLASFPSEAITRATASWYSDRFRLGLVLAFLAVPLISVAVAGPQARSRTPRDSLLRAGSVALGLVLTVTCVVDSVRAIRQNYDNYSLVGKDQRAAFRFLAAHMQPGERVLNQHQDGSPWMYSLYGVAPVFAVKTNDFESSDWEDALYLTRHVDDAGRDLRVDALLDRFDVRFVYVGDKAFLIEKPDLRANDLNRSTRFREVFHQGSAHVFELNAT